MKDRFIIFLSALFFIIGSFAITGAEENVSVASELSRGRIYIGQHTRLTISAFYPDDVDIVFDMEAVDFSGLKLLDSGVEEPVEISSGFIRKQWWFEFTADAPGNYTVLPVTIHYDDSSGRHEFITGSHDLRVVRTVANIESLTDIRDIKPPLPVRRDFARLNLILAGIGIVILLFILIRLVFRRRKARLSAIAEPPPPHIRALTAFEKFNLSEKTQNGGYSVFIMETSKIVRKYIGERFGVHAPEMTTDEVMIFAEKQSYLSPENRALMSAFFHRCDDIKFAAKEPSAGDCKEIIELARKFISKTV